MTRNILITGAGGFIGGLLAHRLAADPQFASASITLLDLALPDPPRGARPIEGDFGDPAVLARALDPAPDLVFHLAAVLGGAAEADYALARRVNIDATLTLLERLRRPEAPPRVIFSSAIAVFGVPLPERIDDGTIALPTMIYGAHKLMVETAVNQFSARGWIDGLSLRFPGIVAHPHADARLKSAFLSTMFHDYAAGRPVNLPVSREATIWLLSAPAVIDALVHAARLDRARLPAQRAFTLPAQRVSMGAIIDSLAALFPHSGSAVAYTPDAQLEAQFGSYPPLTTAIGDSLGFHHDGDLAMLVRNALMMDAA